MKALDWRTDWLYSLILQKAEKEWNQCQLFHETDSGTEEVWKYVLINEYSRAGGGKSLYFGRLLRAWILDGGGLRKITLSENKQHHAEARGKEPLPFVAMSFCIQRNRRRIRLAVHRGMLSGTSMVYVVKGKGRDAELVWDQKGQWLVC